MTDTISTAAALIEHRLGWPEDWQDEADLPSDLAAVLGADEALRLYAVFDGTRRAAAIGMNDLDTLPTSCAAAPLFRGGGAEAESGPWLVELNRGAGDHGAVLRQYLTRLQGEGTGILLLTAAPPRELASHLRGLVKVARQPGADPDVYFRFWDPLTAEYFLPSLATRPDRVARFCVTRAGNPLHMLVETSPTEMSLHEVPPDAPRPPGPSPHRPFALEACDAPVLVAIAQAGLARSLTGWLCKDYTKEIPVEARNAALGQHVLSVGKPFDLTRKEEFAYLAHLMAHFGGWFHQSGQTPGLVDVLAAGGPARHVPLRDAFAGAWSASFRGVVSEYRDAILSDPTWLEDAETGPAWQDRATITRTLNSHIPRERRGPLHALWERAVGTATADGIPQALWPCVALLSLLWGYRFYEDPFLGQSPAARTDDDWAMVCNRFWEMAQDQARAAAG